MHNLGSHGGIRILETEESRDRHCRAFLVTVTPSQARETSLTQGVCISQVWGLMTTGLVWVHLWRVAEWHQESTLGLWAVDSAVPAPLGRSNFVWGTPTYDLSKTTWVVVIRNRAQGSFFQKRSPSICLQSDGVFSTRCFSGCYGNSLALGQDRPAPRTISETS